MSFPFYPQTVIVGRQYRQPQHCPIQQPQYPVQYPQQPQYLVQYPQQPQYPVQYPQQPYYQAPPTQYPAQQQFTSVTNVDVRYSPTNDGTGRTVQVVRHANGQTSSKVGYFANGHFVAS